MNKPLLAVTVLSAFAGLASAQSSVTLYGRLDTNVTVQDPGRAAAATTGGRLGKSVTKLGDGNVNGLGGSRLGFRGVEDLGDGLKAFFLLEAGIFPDQGSAGAATTLNPRGSTFFNRQSYIGLGHKAYGEVRVGRQETLTRENNVKINDATGESTFNIADSVVGSNRPLFQNFGSRIDNGVRYTSPVLGGFQASLIVGLSERLRDETVTPNLKAAEYRGAGLVYAAGPLLVDLLYEELNGGSASGSYNKVSTFGASYDFGVAKLHGAYQNTNDLGGQFAATTFVKGIDHQAWNLGVAVPFGNFTAKAQYTGSSIDRLGALSDQDQDKYGVSLAYAFSKRTAVYAAVSERGGDDSELYTRKNEYVLGLAHTF